MIKNLATLLADWPLWPVCSAPITAKQLTPLGGGLTNQCYLLSLPAGQFVLRLSGDAAKLGIDRAAEYQLHPLLAQHGLAPKIHYLSKNKGYWIRDFIEGTALTAADFQQENLIKMLDLLKKIHQIKLPFALAEISITEKAENYWREILRKNKKFLAIKQNLQDYFQENFSEKNSLCHMDPTPANWIKKPNGQLYLLDWEYAGLGNPLWDIAGLLQELHLTQNQELELLQAYGDFSPQQWHLAKAELKYLEVLWYAVQQITSYQQLELQLNSLLCSLSLPH
ncbi:MAG: choline/ethanolamine kinase family protein [Venatoribacter sp.]